MPVAFSSYLAGFICFGMLIVSGTGLKVHQGTGRNILLAKSHAAGKSANEEDLQLSAVAMVPADNTPAATSLEHADRILVVKSEHTLTLLSHGKAIKVYKVALGSGGLGPKDHEGDRKMLAATIDRAKMPAHQPLVGAGWLGPAPAAAPPAPPAAALPFG